MRRLRILLLILGILMAAPDSITTDTTQARATVAWFEFQPTNGAPGTVVHITGGHWFRLPAPIYIEAPKYAVASSTNDDWLQACDIGTPSNPPVAIAQPDQYGNWSATITIPSTLPSGQRVSKGAVCIIAPSDATDSQPFIILNNALPRSGQDSGQTLRALVLAGLVLILLGLSLLRRMDRRRWSNDHYGV